MVRLPDWQDLGAVPHLDARVPIARPDASALARGNLEADVIGLKQQYAEDADYSGLPQRFDADLQKLAQQHAETIDDPSMRQRFLADAAQFNAGHRAWADQHAFVIGKDAQKAYLDQAGQNFISAAGNTADPSAPDRGDERRDRARGASRHSRPRGGGAA